MIETNLLKAIKRVDSFFKPVDKDYSEKADCSTENQGRAYLMKLNNTEQSNVNG